MRMRKRILTLACAAILGAAVGGRGSAQGGIPWLDNYQEALRQAKATGKPIFLEFRCEA